MLWKIIFLHWFHASQWLTADLFTVTDWNNSFGKCSLTNAAQHWGFIRVANSEGIDLPPRAQRDFPLCCWFWLNQLKPRQPCQGVRGPAQTGSHHRLGVILSVLLEHTPKHWCTQGGYTTLKHTNCYCTRRAADPLKHTHICPGKFLYKGFRGWWIEMIQEKLLHFYKYKEKLVQSCPSMIIYYFTLS